MMPMPAMMPKIYFHVAIARKIAPAACAILRHAVPPCDGDGTMPLAMPPAADISARIPLELSPRIGSSRFTPCAFSRRVKKLSGHASSTS